MTAQAVAPASALPPATSYDDVLYSGHSYIASHPNTMSTIARLMGMTPPRLERCRVLEIGCASGENLIPMAEQWPNATFVGIDLSARHIKRGQGYVERTGVRNVDLRQMDLCDIDESLGTFDYILAHGVYSWIPAPVRDRLMQIYRNHLSENGVGYISYNTFPGWHFFQVARHMMLYRTRTIDDPFERARVAREFMEKMVVFTDAEHGDYSSFAHVFRGFIQSYYYFLIHGGVREDAHLLHDELEQVNDPVYFHQFVEHAARHGLQYVGDGVFSNMMAFNIPRDAAQMLQSIARDRIEVEQYMDFLRNRSFRHTLLCHREVALQQQVDMNSLGSFWVASNAKIEDREDLLAQTVDTFETSEGASISTNHPVSKVAFDLLSREWPAFYQIDVLLDAAYRRMAALAQGPYQPDAIPAQQRQIDRQVLYTNLLKGYATSDELTRLFYEQPRFFDRLSERPRASAWARLQAEMTEMVTNSFHYRVTLDPFSRFLLARLDGTRTFDDLVEAVLNGPVAEGAWTIERKDGGKQTLDQTTDRDIVEQSVEDRLNFLLHAAMLVA